jgi:glycosyltransferase involved in cell wall biosynthesis
MKLSIITINYNNCHGLERTINSVIHQTYNDFEYILIDGGSADKSIDVIKRYSERLTHWLSEPDKGIYHAMNKGITLAKGEYLLFLNSGDYLINENILQTIFVELVNDPIIYGNGLLETKTGKYLKMEIPAKLDLDYFSGASLFHPSTFIKKSLFETYGLYNESLKIVSDWEFFIKAIMLNNEIARKISFEIAVVEDDGISRKKENTRLLQQEIRKVLEDHFPLSVIRQIEENKKSNLNKHYPKKNLTQKIWSGIKEIRNAWKRSRTT